MDGKEVRKVREGVEGNASILKGWLWKASFFLAVGSLNLQ